MDFGLVICLVTNLSYSRDAESTLSTANQLQIGIQVGPGNGNLIAA
jgi:hypothetical protein